MNHGYNFEVPVTLEPALAEPVPLRDMGRFNHEAVCVDPATGIVYQTEDRGDGLLCYDSTELSGSTCRVAADCTDDKNCVNGSCR